MCPFTHNVYFSSFFSTLLQNNSSIYIKIHWKWVWDFLFLLYDRLFKNTFLVFIFDIVLFGFRNRLWLDWLLKIGSLHCTSPSSKVSSWLVSLFFQFYLFSLYISPLLHLKKQVQLFQMSDTWLAHYFLQHNSEYVCMLWKWDLHLYWIVEYSSITVCNL